MAGCDRIPLEVPREVVEETALRHKKIRDIGIRIVSAKSGRIESGPGGVGAPKPGPDHEPDSEDRNEAELIVANVSDATDNERRDHAIGLLDAVRQQYEASRLNRIRYMQLARNYGLSCAEIGVVLGITEGAVRKALQRAGVQ